MHTHWRAGLGFSLTTALMWSLLPLALKEILTAMDPVTITWYRVSLSALVALVWYGYRSGRELSAMVFSRHCPISLLIVAGLMGNYLLYIWGVDRVTAGAAQLLIQLAPLILLLGGVLMFKESFTRRQWFGLGAGVCGMLLFFHPRMDGSVATDARYVEGVIMLIGAAILWSFYGLAQKQLLKRFHAKDILLLICLSGTLLMLPWAQPAQILNLSLWQTLVLLFCGVNTIVAYGAFGLAMSYWEASRVSAVIAITPLLTLAITWGLNTFTNAEIPAEPLGLLGSLGALLVVTGSTMVAMAGRPSDPMKRG
ncbi:MAG: DMT family transporter [Pseudomonadota bacterium]